VARTRSKAPVEIRGVDYQDHVADAGPLGLVGRFRQAWRGVLEQADDAHEIIVGAQQGETHPALGVRGIALARRPGDHLVVDDLEAERIA